MTEVCDEEAPGRIGMQILAGESKAREDGPERMFHPGCVMQDWSVRCLWDSLLCAWPASFYCWGDLAP
eukprot:1161319-Pelagomonas_calceolata.AAC.11